MHGHTEEGDGRKELEINTYLSSICARRGSSLNVDGRIFSMCLKKRISVLKRKPRRSMPSPAQRMTKSTSATDSHIVQHKQSVAMSFKKRSTKICVQLVLRGQKQGIILRICSVLNGCSLPFNCKQVQSTQSLSAHLDITRKLYSVLA